MAGEPTEGANAQALWDEVNEEREAAHTAPSTDLEATFDTPVETADTATTDEVAPPVEAPDPLHGLSPELRARLERLDALEQHVAQIPTLVQTVKTAEGRVAAMQRELDVAKQAAKAVGDAPSAAQIAAAKASTLKWDSLKGDFPEWAEATEQFVKAELAGLKPGQGHNVDPNQIDAMVERRLNEVRTETAKALEEAKVEGKYESWRDIVNTDDFVKWHNAQPPEVQALAQSTKGRDAVRMLDLFHDAKAKPNDAIAASRASKLAAAASTKPGTSVVATKTVDDMSPAELWEHERKRAAKRGSERGLNY